MTSDDKEGNIKFFPHPTGWLGMMNNAGPDHMLEGIMTHSTFGFTLIFAC